MLKQYVETVKRLGTDKDGVVWLEYVIVAAVYRRAVVIALFLGLLVANTLHRRADRPGSLTAIGHRCLIVLAVSVPERGIGMSLRHASF